MFACENIKSETSETSETSKTIATSINQLTIDNQQQFYEDIIN